MNKEHVLVVIPHAPWRKNADAWLKEAIGSIGDWPIVIAKDYYRRGLAHAITRQESKRGGFPRYVVTLDDDDIAMPGAVEKLLEPMARQPKAFAYADFQAFDVTGNVSYPGVKDPTLDTMMRYFGLRGIRAYDWNRVQDVGGFDTTLTDFQDFDLAIRLTKQFGPPLYINEVLTRYRLHAQQMVSQPFNQRLFDWIKSRP
jgi:hypothetical protein